MWGIARMHTKTLTIGERVRVIAGIPSFWRHVGRIVNIVEPFVGETMKEACLLELPLYRVRLDDGRSFRFRGRDLEPMN
jgi:hypothetical protein